MYAEHRKYLEEQLKLCELKKTNAEKTLTFMIDKFTYLFDWKKKIIQEIKYNTEEIKRLKEILSL